MTELATAIAALPHAAEESDPLDRQSEAEHLFGVWVFVFTECLTFAAYFVIYLLYHNRDLETFQQSRLHLSPTFGLVNTLLLLTSSWQVARSVHSARAEQFDAAARQAAVTMLFGAAFVISKSVEWARELSAGHTFGENDFFAFYYFLTGIHVVHVLIGFAFMLSGIRKLRQPAPSPRSMEVAAIYWHMVDFLWVVIFALLYVVR
jgi:nitric oxide reductase NorE protein